MGDMNARVGNEEIRNIMGMYGEVEKNDNGDRLIELSEEFNLKITNTFFQHKEIHKYTWRQVTRNLKSIIDYIIVKQKSTILIKDVRAYRGADCGSDHYLVIGKCIFPWIKMHLNKSTQYQGNNCNKQDKFNVELLHDDSIKTLYQQRMNRELDEDYGQNVDEIYSYIKDKTRKIAYEVLGTKRHIKKERWLTDEIKPKIERKKEAYLKWLQSKEEVHRAEYTNLRNNLKQEIRTLKNESWEKACADINAQIGFNRSKEAWNIIKTMRREVTHRSKINIIKLDEWTSYYTRLLQEQRQHLIDEIHTEENIEVEFSEEEVRVVMKKGKNGKAPGPGGINLELLKCGGRKMLKLITRLINNIIKENIMPKEMTTGYIYSIHKKGDRKQCTNYRGICVTNSLTKIFGKLIRTRLEREFKTSEVQCGFTAGKSCVDNLFIIRQLLQKSHEKMKDIHMIFIDLEKAYDSIPRKLLWKAMEMANISRSTINLVKLMYKNSKCHVQVGEKISEEFKTSKGLLQGCCMSPTLFKIYIDVALKEWSRKCEKMGVKLTEDRYLYNLLFADDQVLIAQDEFDITYMMRKLQETYECWGMNINYEKTEYLTSGQREDLDIEGRRIKNVKSFKYLGSYIQEHGETDTEINSRIRGTRRAISQLNSVLWSQNMLNKTKTLIFKTIIQSILLYGSETWTICRSHEKKLLATEMDYWRRASRVSRLEKKTNIEIRSKMKVKNNIMQVIDERRLRWFGHVHRMNEERLPNFLMEWRIGGKNRRGRPKRKWQDNLTEGLRKYHLRTVDARNRENWRKKLKKSFG